MTIPSEFGVISCDSRDVMRSWDGNAQSLFGWYFQEVEGKRVFPEQTASPFSSKRLQQQNRQQRVKP